MTNTPAQLTDIAAEAIRALNHGTASTTRSDGWEYPSDAHDVIGGLSRAAGRLPQALDQIGALLEALADQTVSDRATLDTDLVSTYAALADAHDAADALYEALNRAWSATSHLAYTD